MKEKELILVKLGGSVITDKTKPFSEDGEVIRRLAREIAEAGKEKEINVIIGHGAGSYGHVVASRYANNGIIPTCEGIAKVQDAVATLNRMIVKSLIDAGENAISVHLSSSSLSENGKITEMFLGPVKVALNMGMVPVPYGDIGFDRKGKCSILSTEEIISYLTKNFVFFENEYRIDKVIVCGRVDGVFTGNPDNGDDCELIELITPKTLDSMKDYLAESSGIDVTGGMKQKVGKLIEMANLGVECSIINGNVPGRLKDALLGKEVMCTAVRAD